MMKRHLLFAMLCIVGALKMSAQIVETDMTSQFSSLTDYRSWTGASGYTATGFCPMVTVGGGIGQKQVCERYVGNCNETGDIFYATVTGLTAGTYKIELYGGAAFTYGRGFASTAFTNGSGDSNSAYNAGDKMDPPGTGVTLYAQSEGVTYGGEIPIYYATNFPDGAATVTIEGVVVGTSGQIKIGMSKTSTSTNWHVIQLKSVIAQVDLSDLVDAKKNELQTLINEGTTYESYSTDLASALTTARGYIATDVSSDAAAAQQLISDMENAIAALPALIATAKNAQSVDGASAQNPIVTNFVINGTFDTAGNVAPWKATGGFQNQTTANNQQGAFTGNFFENWNPSANANKMYQDIANIPNGVYKLNICAFVNTFGGTQYVFANNAKTNLTTGTPTAYEVFVEVTNGSIQVGLEQTTATANWMGIDNVSLTYYGNCTIEEAQFGSLVQDLDDLKAQIRAITAVPQVIIDNDEITLDSYDASTFTTAQQYQDAISALTEVLTARQAAAVSYANLTELKGYVTTLLAVPYVELVSGAHAALENANADESGLTSVELINQAVVDLKSDLMTYVANADPAEGSQFDLTFLLVNPDVTSLWTGAWDVRPEGWYNDQNGGNFQVMANEEMGPGGEVFMEYWRGDAAQSGFVLYQKVTLPEGTYKMTGRVGLQQIGDGATGTTPNMTFSANDTDGSQIAVGPLADQEVEFINSINQEVKIGIKAHAGNCYRWIGINKIRLYKYPTDNTEFAISVNSTNATVNVSVDGVDGATAAKKLDAVNFTVAPDVNCVIESITVTYVDGDNTTQTITPTDLGNGAYTFQMPAYDVTITVVASVDKTALQGVIADAQAFDATSVPAQVLTPLTQALNAAIAVNEDTDATAQEVADAQQALFGALQDALNFAVPYAAYLELKAYAVALVAVDNDNAGENSTFAQAISTAETNISTVTTADAAADVNAALRAAMDTYATLANPQGDGAKFDLTYMLTNPDVTPFWDGEPGDADSGSWGVIPDGWGSDQPDGNKQVMTNADVVNGDKAIFYEYWSDPAKANGLFTLYNTAPNLPEGFFEMSCYAFASPNNVEGATNNQVYFYANDTQGSLVANAQLSEQHIEFKNATQQDVRIGLKALSGNQFRWMGIGYVKLYKVPAKAFIIDEDDDDYDYTQEGAGDVIIRNRTIKEGYNTLVLPFSMTQPEVEQVFGQGAKISVVASYDVAKEHLRFIAQDGVVANRPCLLNATQPNDGSDILIEGRTLVPGSLYPTYDAPNVVMTGTYETQTYVPENSWFMQGGSLVYAPDDISCWVNLGRAYITLGDGSHPVKGLTVSFEDGATGIAIIENGEMNILTGKIYDLSGREVQNPTRGIYIINGKKVMIK